MVLFQKKYKINNVRKPTFKQLEALKLGRYKGKYHTEETKKKIKEAKIGKPNKGWFEKGNHSSTEFKKGVKFSEETRKKMKESHKKGGISKTSEYRAFSKRRRKIRKRNNGGSHTFGEWENLKAQYDWTCPCCKKSEPEIKLTEDHIIPLIKGGSDNIENIQPLCRSCNCKKHTKIIKYESEADIGSASP